MGFFSYSVIVLPLVLSIPVRIACLRIHRIKFARFTQDAIGKEHTWRFVSMLCPLHDALLTSVRLLCYMSGFDLISPLSPSFFHYASPVTFVEGA